MTYLIIGVIVLNFLALWHSGMGVESAIIGGVLFGVAVVLLLIVAWGMGMKDD